MDQPFFPTLLDIKIHSEQITKDYPWTASRMGISCAPCCDAHLGMWQCGFGRFGWAIPMYKSGAHLIILNLGLMSHKFHSFIVENQSIQRSNLFER